MKKEILATTILLAIFAFTLTPMVGIVSAGKGQEKLDFELHVIGLPELGTGSSRLTPDPSEGPITHSKDVEWGVLDVLEVTIGGTIITEDISYSCKLDADYNTVTLKGVQRIRETIIFSNIDGEEGTLEILTIGKLETMGATFTGHGTGALEGVKVSGTTSSGMIEWAGVPPFRVETVREGTVMGWPMS